MRWCKYVKVILVLLSATIFTVTIHKVPYGHFKDLLNNSVVERLFHEEPCACMERCLAASDDEWFAEHFRKDVPPALSLNNSVLPDHIFKWWQSLQSTRSKANYSQVIKELFSVVPGEEWYRDTSPSRCRTCAVVGNSGNLLGSYYGPVIDNHDFVFRGELPPPAEPVLPRFLFSILSPMAFWFLAAVASGLLSWGHLISIDIVDLIAQILFKLN